MTEPETQPGDGKSKRHIFSMTTAQTRRVEATIVPASQAWATERLYAVESIAFVGAMAAGMVLRDLWQRSRPIAGSRGAITNAAGASEKV